MWPSFEEAYAKYHRVVSTAVYNIIGPNQEEIDEVCMDVWERVFLTYNKLCQYQRAGPSTVLFRIGLNRAKVFVRDKNRRQKKFAELDAMPVETAPKIDDCYSPARLNPLYKIVFDEALTPEQQQWLREYTKKGYGAKLGQKAAFRAWSLRKKLRTALTNEMENELL
jgi:DNA-directed RNA polymerase specialized sigma24 family protein